MATDPPESDHRWAGERHGPQIGGDTELELISHYHRAKALQKEIEARDLELAELGDAANTHEEELRGESTRQTAYFEESLNRLQREMQEQSMESEERVRELKAQIEHLKITRFQAKRENYSIKTSLSWRLTWPLRVLRDAGASFVQKSRARFGLFPSRRPASPGVTDDSHSAANVPPGIDAGSGSREQQAAIDRQSIELFTEGLSRLNREKENVFLVTHESSRTGAPILALNMTRVLRQKYNIVVVILRDGALGYEFLAGSDLVIGPLKADQRSEDFLTALFEAISARVPIKFAIVNSIVSTVTLGPLWENDIATLHLIHEFSSYIRPRGQFRSSAFYAGEQIFSSEIVRENARQELPRRARAGWVLPQGMCLPPLKSEPGERERIRSDLRPAGWPADTVVILGAGAVTFRKGVDLFLACAKRVAEMAPAKKFRFVWFGEGMDTGLDAKYALYLEDQVQRSGLNGVAAILKAVSDMEAAYLDSDLLFLSSRLDPLPSVCLEAIHFAKPVVCFESATGIAEYLARDPEAAFGIVPFLDIESAAGRIFRLIEDPDLRLRTGQASKRLESWFRFDHYVEEIDRIARQCALKKQQERADRLVISQSNLFDAKFFSSPLTPPGSRDLIRHYLTAYSSGIRPRKAVPGFHPGMYGERNALKGRDPLAHYLANGQPAGPWKFDVIHAPAESCGAHQSLKVALHLHLYHHEMSNEILERLQGTRSRIDLLISVTSQPAAEAVARIFSGWSRGAIDVRVFENRGRDLGPFLTGFGEVILGQYDVVGHLHTKKSAGKPTCRESPTPEFLESISQWKRFLFANLLGGETSMADAIIQRLSEDQTIGLVFPDDPNFLGWGENLPYAENLARGLGIVEQLPKTTFNFPVGSMFWARTAALRPLLELGLTWSHFPAEPVPYDGSLLHAIERLLPFVVEGAGFRCAVTHVPGVTR